ncbi:alpha/beta fold hydrolase [Sphingobacterium puteale]|uniref:Alpha/beta fold hydrolase n=1 Tax=Sphingobacterium puteale TaxID=2420510 RepID=A0A420VQU8_9SPHI|nr:alpha/beta fold hydrolase [Sphingobacterium puteale]RKO68731.1 alpha/beta fold hydrolase [Sphingobacterium puteale]
MKSDINISSVEIWTKQLSVWVICLFPTLVIFPSICNGQDKKSWTKEEWNTLLTEQLFPGKKIENLAFNFDIPFEEKYITMKDSIVLNGLLFKAKIPKGLIFYLHGSNDALDTWGKIAPIYTANGYDIFMLDYRGYGKSQGKVTDESMLYNDIQIVYNKLKTIYSEHNIIVLGQSMGSALASNIAANNQPGLLILQAPYYNLVDWVNNVAPELDTTNIPFSFDNASHLKKVKCPIVIFHGSGDNAVYYGSSTKLSKLLKSSDRFITLNNEGHNDFSKNKVYLKWIGKTLRSNQLNK